MPTAHLTDIVVSRLKTPGTYFDETTPAFAIRVGKNRKTWFVIRGRERLRTNIGQYPHVSLANARKEAKRLLTEEPSKAASLRVETACTEFFGSLSAKKARTQRDYRRLLSKYLLPTLAKKKLGEVTYEDVTGGVASVAECERTHALAVARTFFRWCVRPPRRYIKHSPLEGLQLPPAKKRKRKLTEEELVTVWRAAEEQGYPHGTVVQLLILMGQRRGETAWLRRPWINEKDRTITLPEWLTKNKKEHMFPYGEMTALVFDSIPRWNDTDLLFPSKVSNERPISGFSKFKKAMTDGVPGWRLHDLRRTFRSLHGQIGTPREIAERHINHVDGVTTEVEQIYDVYTYLPQMRTAIEKYEGFIEKLLAR